MSFMKIVFRFVFIMVIGLVTLNSVVIVSAAAGELFKDKRLVEKAGGELLEIDDQFQDEWPQKLARCVYCRRFKKMRYSVGRQACYKGQVCKECLDVVTDPDKIRGVIGAQLRAFKPR